MEAQHVLNGNGTEMSSQAPGESNMDRNQLAFHVTTLPSPCLSTTCSSLGYIYGITHIQHSIREVAE